jgi:tetratricopeptide (TPR) repeat protein
MGKSSASNAIYQKIKNTDESYLKLVLDTYKSLHIYAIEHQLKKDVLYFYQKFTQYHHYNCSVENNMAVFYMQQKMFKKARAHINTVLEKEPKCANQQVIKLLKNYVKK